MTGSDVVSGQPPKKSPKRLRRMAATWSRWLHIYLSMFGSVVILFFSLTGLTLNHPEWFFDEQISQRSGTVNVAWLDNQQPPPADWDESDYGHEIDKLDVAEYLRAQHGLKGAVSDFLTFSDECEVTFEGPGYLATARITRATGQYELNVTTNDLITILNDLHKGRHSGFWWSILIDVSAVIGTLTGISGFILIFFLRLRRVSGIACAAFGALLFSLCYWIATK